MGESAGDKVYVRIGPDTEVALHRYGTGPSRTQRAMDLYVGPNPCGPRGGTNGTAVDATYLGTGNSKYFQAYADIYRHAVGELVAGGRTLAVTVDQDAAIYRASYIASYPRTHEHAVAILLAELPEIPEEFRPAVAATLGQELMDAAVAKLAERRQHAAKARLDKALEDARERCAEGGLPALPRPPPCSRNWHYANSAASRALGLSVWTASLATRPGNIMRTGRAVAWTSTGSWPPCGWPAGGMPRLRRTARTLRGGAVAAGTLRRTWSGHRRPAHGDAPACAPTGAGPGPRACPAGLSPWRASRIPAWTCPHLGRCRRPTRPAW